MNETLEQFRSRMKRELDKANNQDLLAEVKSVQKARGWTFERSWSHVMAEQPAFARSLTTEKVNSVAGREKRYAVIEAKAQRLIKESRGRLTMSAALVLARREEPEEDPRLKDARVKLERPVYRRGANSC